MCVQISLSICVRQANDCAVGHLSACSKFRGLVASAANDPKRIAVVSFLANDHLLPRAASVHVNLTKRTEESMGTPMFQPNS
jgi:hypothetical protein